jgi:hypothetical protein
MAGDAPGDIGASALSGCELGDSAWTAPEATPPVGCGGIELQDAVNVKIDRHVKRPRMRCKDIGFPLLFQAFLNWRRRPLSDQPHQPECHYERSSIPDA